MTDSLLEQILSELQALHAEVVTLRADLTALRGLLTPLTQRTLPFPSPPVTPEEAEQLVTLDQAAAMVKRAKSTLERYRDRMPKARSRGRRGQPNLWLWRELRPWLEEVFNFRLPERFPA